MQSTITDTQSSTLTSEFDSFTERAMDCLDDLYSTAIRLTHSMPDAEQLVQTTLEQGAKLYKPANTQTISFWLLGIMTRTFHSSLN